MKNVIASLLLLLVVGFGCNRIEEPEFREIRNFKVRNIGLDEVTITFAIEYFNPNDFSVSVKETAAKVYLDSTYLGDFRQDSIIAVGDNASFTIPLSGSIPLTSFFKMDLKDIHKRQVLIQANGNTRVGKAGIFINKKINYRGRHRLSQLRF